MLLQLFQAAISHSRSRRRSRNQHGFSTLPALVDRLEDRTMLSVITVTNLNDSGSGSLRDAVASANVNPGADVIRFQAKLSGTIALTSGEMEITDALKIDGTGASRITISGNNASRVFKMGPGTDVSIEDVTIANGRNTTQDSVGIIVTRGGAILNDGGELHLTRVAMRNNQTIDAGGGPAAQVVGGGAVVNSGDATLTAKRCVFIGNTASGGTSYAFGGAIGNVTNSVATIKDCTFIDNVATAGATNYGGAIGNFGSSQLTVTGCTFENNSALGTDSGEMAFGGAIATRPGTVVSSGSTTNISRSKFINNRAAGGEGGDAGGGALYNVASTLFVQQCDFKGNQAIGGDGGSNGGNAFGGAIDATAVNPAEPPLTRISQSRFVGNRAQSGDAGSGSGSLAAGGALYNAIGQMELTHSSIVGNFALGGESGQGIGGGIYNLATVNSDRQTLRRIAGNSASTSDNNIYGPVTTV